MKRIFLNLLINLFCVVSIAQIQDLSDLASGQFVDFGMLFNNYDPDNTCYVCDEKADVFGYYSLYNNGEVKENLYEIEYILFDKNLNKFSNGTFHALKGPRKTSSYVKLYKKQDTILAINKLENFYKDIYVYQKVSLKDNKLHKPYYYEKGNIKELDINEMANELSKKKLKDLSEKNKLTETQRDSARNRKTLFSYKEDKIKLLKNIKSTGKVKYPSQYTASLELVDNDTQIWETELQHPVRHEFFYYEELFIDKKQKQIGLIRDRQFKRVSNSEFQLYDLDSGKLIAKAPFNTSDDYYMYKNIGNLTGDNLTVMSALIDIKTSLKGLGFFRYDVKSKKELLQKTFLWEDANKFIKISKRGQVEKGYKLKLLNYFFLKNGSFGLLAEKSKASLFLAEAEVTSDFVFFMFNKNLDLEDVKIIEKDKTLSLNRDVDYLFSQEVEGGSLIYYKDYQKGEGDKRKKWFLGIISYINGEFGHQKIPMSSEDYSILPYPAKEGYILLREFNDTNNKYNKIRLEKINY